MHTFCILSGFGHLDAHIMLTRDMTLPAMWYVRPAKAQTSLRKRATWSEPLLVG